MTELARRLARTNARARSKESCARMLAYRKLLRSGSAAASRSASRLRRGARDGGGAAIGRLACPHTRGTRARAGRA